MDRNAMLAMMAAMANQPQPQKKLRGCLGCGPGLIIAIIVITILIWLPWEALIK
jgi:hypothetical protein